MGSGKIIPLRGMARMNVPASMKAAARPGYLPRRGQILLVVFLAVILPRLCGIGYFIYMDEGYHAFIARYAFESIAAGHGFPPDMSGFKLFPLLCSWLWALPGNGVIWLRFADMLAAACAGWAFCRLLAAEAKNAAIGLWLAFAFMLGLNVEGAIQSGFKNSFAPAFLCLFCALNAIRGARPDSSRWYAAGALTAAAVLFRETFAPFALLACASLAFARCHRQMWRYMAGGIMGAICIFGICALWRGQGLDMLAWYFSYGKIYEPEADLRLIKFFANGGKALTVYWPLLLLALFAAYCLWRAPGRQINNRALFWLAAAALPLLEPFAKIGFLYHFSVCLPGLAGFCAWAYARLPSEAIITRKRERLAAVLAACLMLAAWLPHFGKLPVTLQTLQNFPRAGWPAALTDQSTTLQAAAALRKLAPAGATVSSSGFAYFIYPASGMRPPAIGLEDLSRSWIYAGQNEEKFLKALAQNPPDIVLIGLPAGEHISVFWRQLRYIFERHPDYEYAGLIEPDAQKNYGWLGYLIYKRKDSAKAGQKTVNSRRGRPVLDAWL